MQLRANLRQQQKLISISKQLLKANQRVKQFVSLRAVLQIFLQLLLRRAQAQLLQLVLSQQQQRNLQQLVFLKQLVKVHGKQLAEKSVWVLQQQHFLQSLFKKH